MTNSIFYATSMPTKWSLLSLIEAARVWVDDHTSWVIIAELSCVLCSMLIFLHTSVGSFCGHLTDVMWCDVIITGLSAVNQSDGWVHLALAAQLTSTVTHIILLSDVSMMCYTVVSYCTIMSVQGLCSSRLACKPCYDISPFLQITVLVKLLASLCS